MSILQACSQINDLFGVLCHDIVKKMTFHKSYRVDKNQKVDLSDWDAGDTSLYDGEKDEGKEHLKQLNEKLEALQRQLYAEHKHKILIVLQGMDTSGKDGTIRHVFSRVNPQGVLVHPFKKPTIYERERDYLWRVHQMVPRQGHMAIFNRSHYEDVLVPVVGKVLSEDQCEKRYRQINDFERMLNEEGTHILKFFLHIDAEEQAKRLQDRLKRPEKNWKFDPSDIEARKKWYLYQEAYECLLAKTSTDHAPWYIIPSNKKWYRNLVVSTLLVDLLEGLQMKYPSPLMDFSQVVIPTPQRESR